MKKQKQSPKTGQAEMNNGALNILFVQESPCIRNYKIAKALTSKGHRVSLAYTKCKLSEMYDLSDEIYDELIPVKQYRELWDMSKNYDVLHCHNEPDLLTVNCLAGDAPVVHGCHDLISLRHGENMDLRYYEGIANRGASGIVYVSELQRQEAHDLYGVDLDRTIVLHNYVLKDDIPSDFKPKLSEKNGGMHIVYEGSLGFGAFHHRNYMLLFKNIAKKGLHIHIHPSFHSDDYEREFKDDPYVHYNRPISPQSIVYEMSQYDFGIIPFRETKENRRHINTMLPNKLFEYLAAGLPVIAQNLTELKDFVEHNKIGIVFKSEEDIVQSLDELKSVRLSGIKNVSCTMEDKIDTLINFYRKL